MKSQQSIKHILALIISATAWLGHAQERVATISGTIMDKQTRRAIEAASITIPGTDIGTVSNADGHFTLRVSSTAKAIQLLVSHIGYENLYHPIAHGDAMDVKFYLTPNSYALDAVNVYGGNARELVTQAVRKIADNYEDKDNLLTGFYRETIQKRRHYTTITEAVVGLYKSPYRSGIRSDRVQLYKGRKILTPKSGDTLSVKLAGGPMLAVYLDIAKNMNFMLDRHELENYDFAHDMLVSIDNKTHYAIKFKPRLKAPYALFSGTLYIDEKTLTIARAEMHLEGSELEKATTDMLRKKPAGLRFGLNGLSYTIAYRSNGGRNYLYYARSEIKFSCDWRRRLFNTNYTITSELVTTDRQREPTASIAPKDAFRQSHSLDDRASDFYDPNFWGEYNIIEPTESLEHAINRIKKQRR